MKVERTNDGNVSIAATEKEWAKLSKIIEWIITEKAGLDDASCLLEPEEIDSVLDGWSDTLHDSLK